MRKGSANGQQKHKLNARTTDRLSAKIFDLDGGQPPKSQIDFLNAQQPSVLSHHLDDKNFDLDVFQFKNVQIEDFENQE